MGTLNRAQMRTIIADDIIDRGDKNSLINNAINWGMEYIDKSGTFADLHKEEITLTTISCEFTMDTNDIIITTIDIPTGTKIVFTAENIATLSLGSGGTGYTAGDVITIVQSGGSGGTVTISTVSSGVITAVALLAEGSGYSVASGLPVTGGTGSGATINILTIGGTLPAGLIASTDYWAIRQNATTIKVATSHKNAWIGTVVSITSGTGSGTYTIKAYRERLAKPSSCKYIYSVRLIDGGMSRKLEPLPTRKADLYTPFGQQLSVGRPTQYCEWLDWIQLSKIPDATYVIKIRYIKWQDAFGTDDDAETAEINHADDLIIKAAAAFVWEILGEPEQAALMRNALEIGLHKHKKFVERMKPDLVLKPHMGTIARSDADTQDDPFIYSQR